MEESYLIFEIGTKQQRNVFERFQTVKLKMYQKWLSPIPIAFPRSGFIRQIHRIYLTEELTLTWSKYARFRVSFNGDSLFSLVDGEFQFNSFWAVTCSFTNFGLFWSHKKKYLLWNCEQESKTKCFTTYIVVLILPLLLGNSAKYSAFVATIH